MFLVDSIYIYMVHQIELLQAENKEKDSKIAEQQAKLELKDLQYAELQKQLKNTESSSEDRDDNATRCFLEEWRDRLREKEDKLNVRETNLGIRTDKLSKDEEELKTGKTAFDEEKKAQRFVIAACTVFTIITLIMAASVKQVFWTDFKTFWSASGEILADSVKTTVATFWRYSGVALYIPHRVIARVAQDMLFILMMSVLPGGTILLVVRHRKELVKACKTMFSGMFLPVAATLLLFCIFYGDMTIKRLFPWWNLWGMWFLAFLISVGIKCAASKKLLKKGM